MTTSNICHTYIALNNRKKEKEICVTVFYETTYISLFKPMELEE